MDALPLSVNDLWTAAGMAAVVSYIQSHLIAFLLIVTRMSGLLALSPVFGHPQIPKQVRALLVLALSLLIAPPLLADHSSATFRRLDINRDGWLTAGEVPAALEEAVLEMRRNVRREADSALARDEFQLAVPAPRTLTDFVWLAVAEFGVGFALSLGVITILSSMQLAGHLIDYQTGLSLGQIFNPQLGSASSQSGELLNWLGTAVYLIAGGHLMLMSSLIDSFQSLPIGYAMVSTSTIDLLRELVQQSLVLALQISAPIVITLTVVGFAMGVLGHTVTTINFIDVGIPVRVLVGMLVFGAALVRLAELLAAAIPQSLLQLRDVLAS